MLFSESGEMKELFRKHIDRDGNTLWFAEDIPVTVFLNDEQKSKLCQASKYYSLSSEDGSAFVPDKLLIRAVEIACHNEIDNVLDYMYQNSRSSFDMFKEKQYERPIALKWEGNG